MVVKTVRVVSWLGVALVLAAAGCSSDSAGGTSVVNYQDTGLDETGDAIQPASDAASPGPSAGDVTAAPIVIERLSPARGPTSGGSIVQVEGFGFNSDTKVWLRDAAVTIIKVLDSTRMVVKTPAGSAGAADVTVEGAHGAKAVFTGGFTYWEPGADTAPAPRIVDVAPGSGPAKGGTAMLLRGSGFQQGAAIFVGWHMASTRTIGSPTEASCLTPSTEAGTLDVAITNPDGQSHVLVQAFGAYGDNRETAPAPTVSALTPAAGSVDGGTIVHVTGSNFMTGSVAMLGGISLPSWKTVDDSNGTFTTLAHIAGLTSLWLTNQDGQTAIVHDAFQFYVEPPVVYSITPDHGPAEGGNLVTIVGAHFRAGATVTLGSIECQSVTFVSESTLSCVVPPASTASVVDVAVTNPDGLSGVLPLSYAYALPKQPLISGVVPESGALAGGVLVLIQGENIEADATVSFGAVVATTVAVPGTTSLIATLPAGTAAGLVDVTVTNPSGLSSTLTDGFTYLAEAAPTVAEVVPDTGLITGGYPVAILGSGIAVGASVQFGSVMAPSIVASGVGGIVAVAPAHAPGLVDVTVTNPDGQKVLLAGAFTFQAPPALRIDGVLPSAGPIGGGTLATVRGQGFLPGAVIRFGGLEASVTASLGAAGAVVTVPASLVAGVVDVTATNLDGSSAALPAVYTYEANKPVAVSGVVPGSGTETGGVQVTVLGQGFQPGAAVRFGAVQAIAPLLVGDSTLVVTQPPLPVGDVDVTVVNVDSTSATLKSAFTVLPKAGPPPKSLGLVSVTPATGPSTGGGFVLVSGSGFPSDLSLRFGGAMSTEVHVLSPTLATARVPSGAPGTVEVTASEPLGGTATLAGGYAYLIPKPGTGPVLVDLSPATGPAAGGTLARVDGSSLLAGGLALLDGIPASALSVVSPALASIRTPAGDVGPAELVWVNPDGQWTALSAAFVYTAGSGTPLGLTGVSPIQGPPSGGTAITVSGSGFASGSLLFFDGIPVDATVVNGQAIVATTPPHAAGAVTAYVTSPTGVTAALPSAFTYAAAAPVIHNVVPKHGPASGGVGVTVIGTGFAAGDSVTFGSAPCAGVNVVSPTELTCTAPAGVAGASVVVTVAGADGLAGLLPGAFTYDAPPPKPTLAAVSPATGPTTGGRLALLIGAGFQAGASVTFGGVPATDLHVASADALVCTVPPHVEGDADVIVINPDGGSATLSHGYTYVVESVGGVASSLTLASIEPATGPATGGGFVILRGYDFQAGLTARFGAAASPFVRVLDVTTAVARVPAGPVGPSNVTVTSAQGATSTLNGGYSYFSGAGSAPSLSQMKPPIGPTLGGTLAVIAGQNLQAGAMLFLDGAPASHVLRTAATLATAQTPPGDAGPADVTWVNPDGAFAELKGGFVYTPGPPTPVQVSGVSPIQGSVAGGTAIAVTGSGFQAGAQFFLSGIPVAANVASTKTLTATTPAHTPGLVDAALTLPDGSTATLSEAFNFVLEQPFVAAVTPAWGLEADLALGKVTVTIQGQGFNPAAVVRFGNTPAPLVTWLDGGRLSVVVPSLPLGKYDVSVTNPDGLSDGLGGAFESVLVAPGSAPTLTGIAPNIGPLTGGTVVVLTGANLPADAAVLFGSGVAVQVTVLDSSTILATAPAAGQPGAVDVQIVAASGTLVLPKAFIYYDGTSLGPWPVLAGVRPPIGPTAGGTIAAIDVQPALATAKVWVGGLSAAVLGADASGLLVVRMPPHAAGPVAVTVVHTDGKSDTLQGAFTYYAGPKVGQKAPVLSQLQPSGGSTSGGTAVAYLGDRIDDEAISFLGYRGLVQPKWIDASRVEGKTPVGDVGLADAAVTNPDGLSAVLPAAFAFIAPKPNPDLIFPSVGKVAGGTKVVISGHDFHPQATVSIGGQVATGVVVHSADVLVATLPPGAVGPADVVVTNPGGLSGTLVAGFTYTNQTFTSPPPKPVSLVPDHGPYAGGTVLAIFGTGFQPGARVLFGNAISTVHRAEAGLIVLTTPKGFVGLSDVTVLNPDGQSSTLAAGFTYLSPVAKAPKVFGVTPPSGPEIGGTAAIITGEAFTGGGLGFVGYRPLSSWAVLNTAIGTGTVGLLEPGAHDVVVTNGDGQSAKLPNAFNAVAAPAIDTFDPNVGPVAGGTLVTIAGKGFASGLTLKFGGQSATAIQVLSPYVIKAMTPPGAVGPAAVEIGNPDGQKTVAAMPFEYLLPPTIASIFPTKGPSTGGTPVVLSGTGFLPTSKVTFGNKAAITLAWVDETVLVVAAPAGVIGQKADITVTNPDLQSAILYTAFTWLDPATLPPAPTLAGVTPATGPSTGGTWGLVNGTNLEAGSVLLLGGAPSVTQIYGSTLGRFVAPPGKVGAVHTAVVTPSGLWADIADGFTYTDPATLGPAPAVSELDPALGPTKGATKVTLVGIHLDAGALVFFDTAVAPATQAVTGGLEATTPVHAAGPVSVRVTNTDGQTVLLGLPYAFVPPPTITTVTPVAGPGAGGTFVTIAGADFRQTPTVLFCVEYAALDDCTPAASLVWKSATKLEAVTPAHTAGIVEVVVVNPDGQFAVKGGGFLFSPPPHVYSVVPPSGSTLGGTLVTLEGTAFQAGATVTIGGVSAVGVVVKDSEHITLTTPPGTTGPAVIVVRNADGATHTLAGGFLYVPPPIITNVFPNLGPETGGTVITIQGSGFVPGASGSVVKLGSVLIAANKTQVVSPILIQIEAPPGVGPAAIRVTNPDGQFAVLAGAFTYIPPVPSPKITTVAPPYGPTGGGFQVKITGNNFLDGVEVSFGVGGVWAKGFLADVKNNGTLIVVTAPAYPAGKVDVKVQNSDGQQDILASAFEYTAPSGLPGLAFAGVDPKRGPIQGGYVVAVYGQGFKQGVRVFVGKSSTSDWTESSLVVRLGPTVLRVKMPAHVAGPVDIRVSNPALGGVADEVIGTNAFVYGQGAVFAPKGQLLPIDATQADRDSVIVDVNGDGLSDVFVTHAGGGRPDLFINTRDANGRAGVFVDQSLQLVPGDFSSYWDQYWPVALDADGDGDQDILVYRAYYDYRFWLFRNQGDGKLIAEPASTSISGVYDMVVAELSCDGKPDIFISRWSDNNDEILTGDGHGYWTLQSGVIPTLREPSRGVAASDVDHDGDTDLIIGNDVAYQDRLYFNNCNNIQLPPNCIFDPPGCAAETFDGHRYAMCKDGRNWYDAEYRCQQNGMHLATMNTQEERQFIYDRSVGNYVWVGYKEGAVEGAWSWINDLTSVFVPWCGSEPNDGAGSQCAFAYPYGSGCLADTSCGSGYWSMCEAPTTVMCPTPWQFTNAAYGPNKNFPNTGFDTYDTVVVDINNDGWDDVFMANNGQSNRIYMNANGNFLADDGLRFPQEEPNMKSIAVTPVDLDVDGDTDLVITKDVGGVIWPEIYLNDKMQGGIGTFTNASLTNMPARRTEDTQNAAVGDLNGDGLPDIHLINYNHQDWLMLNHGYQEDKPDIEQNRVPIGSFANNTNLGYPEDAWDTVAGDLGDIDGDGDLDLVVVTTNPAQTMRLWVNDGLGNYFDQTGSRLPTIKRNARMVKFVDLNGDGDKDIVELDDNTAPGFLTILANDGTGRFMNVSAKNTPSVGVDWQNFEVADMDKDGDLDLVGVASYYTDWSTTLMINGGDAFNTDAAYFFVQPNNIPNCSGCWHPTRAVAIADMNKDLWPDVYVGLNAGQNRLLFNDGTAHFQDKTQSHLSAVSDSTRDVDLFDADLDGDIDIFVTNGGDNRLHLGELAFKLGDVTASNLPLGMGYDSYCSAVGDYDKDGLPDVVTANWNQKNNLLLNIGSGFFDNFTDNLPNEVDYSRYVLSGDTDGDGDLDLIFLGAGADRIYLNETPSPIPTP